MNTRRPTLCIVAGPNGSGKTSTTWLLFRTIDGEVAKRYTDDVPQWARDLVK